MWANILNWGRFIEETAVVWLLWRACYVLGKLLRQAIADREAREIAIHELALNTEKLAKRADELAKAKDASQEATTNIIVDTIHSTADAATGRVVDAIHEAGGKSR